MLTADEGASARQFDSVELLATEQSSQTRG